jgi:TolB-like protein/Tfp pilus assembly protein PilF
MTRRLAAIMFTDIAGYTALSQRDEPAALRLLQDQERLVRGLLEVHQGRLVKSMGDGLLIEFANALDAVECAVDLQRHIGERNAREPRPELRVRIGVHLGDVEGVGPDILGDAVNVASRLEPLAEPGGICISAQVYDQVHNKVSARLERLGSRDLKGVREPVVVYTVAPPRTGVEEVAEGPRPHRLAVLPLANMSPDPNDEFFADGLTEEIISTISKIPELSVISRTSVMRYKSQTKPMVEIGHELSATTVLEGSVRKAGNRVRVAVQLIDAVGDRHLWAENYDRSLDDIFAIQSEIAQKIAGSLEIRLLDSDRGRIAKAPTQVTEANLLYMKGAFHAERLTKTELEIAIDFYEQAVREDPRYARAYAAMARAYNLLGLWEIIPSRDAYAHVERAARKAIELDDSLAEAHTALSAAQFYYRDWKRAQDEAKRALELDPNLAEAHLWTSTFCLIRGQTDRAISEAQKAIELDPLSISIMQNAATMFLYGGRPETAIPLYEKVLELNPGSSFARGNLGLCYVQLGRPEDGIEEIRKAIAVSRRSNPAELSDLVYALSQAARIDDARTVIAELHEIHEKKGTGAASLAYAYASIGDADRAFEWLEKAFQEGSGYLGLLTADFSFKDLSTDPRFQKFLEKIGLPVDR